LTVLSFRVACFAELFHLLYSILKQHAVVKTANNEITIEPASPGAKTKVNGMPLTGERVLKHYDRILFGKRQTAHQNFVNPRGIVKRDRKIERAKG